MTPSLKAQIEKEALNDCVCGPGPCSHKTAYIHGATPYAEKLEAAEQENKRLREGLKRIVSIVEQYHSTGSSSPVANHCRMIAIDELAKTNNP